MQHDEMIWQVVNHQFCSFKATIGKAKSDKTHFCRNPYSVTGLCNRTSCPLANSRNYGKALTQLDEHLAYFPKVLMHRNKQRLTKIHQYLIRMRKIELQKRAGKKAKLVGIHRKIDQREERREKKALVAAKIERHIEKELVERLAKGTYGDIYNFPEMPYQKALDAVEEATAEYETEDETESMVEYVEDLESEEELEDEEEDVEDMEYLGNGEWGDLDGDSEEGNQEGDSDDDDGSDDGDDSSNADEAESSSSSVDKKKPEKKKPKSTPDTKKPASRRGGPRIEIEYEEEREDAHAVAAETAW